MELPERAVRMVQEHRKDYPWEWATIRSSGEKVAMQPASLRLWLRRAQREHGQRPGGTSAQHARIQERERETRELRRANDSLKAASAVFARELDPRLPTR